LLSSLGLGFISILDKSASNVGLAPSIPAASLALLTLVTLLGSLFNPAGASVSLPSEPPTAPPLTPDSTSSLSTNTSSGASCVTFL